MASDFANGCIGTDSISISVLPVAAELSIGNDTIICEGTNITFDAGVGFETYQWSISGESTQTLTADIAGIYWVEVSNECGTNRDSVSLEVAPIPDIQLGNDTTLCEGETITLDAGLGYSSYLWSDSTINQTMNVTTSGTYNVVVGNAANCENQDYINILFNPLPWVNIGHDFVLCDGDSSILDAGDGFVSYKWSQGDTTQTIQIKDPAIYHVTISDDNGCYSSDSVDVSYSPSPEFDSIYNPDDGVLAIKMNPTIGLPPYHFSVTDQLGNTLNQGSGVYSGLEPGEYLVEVVDDNGCLITSNGIVKEFIEIFVPNVFTPNGDGVNDIWRVPSLADFPEGIVRVYDRWGKLIIEFSATDDGWDGTYNNELMPSDSYWYLITLRKGKNLKGYFTLKR